LTFKHVFTEWIEKQSIRETTKKQYMHQSKLPLKMFGNKLIQDITKNDILEFLQSYQIRGKLATCYQLYRILRRVFDYCVAYDYIEYNICDRIKYKIIFKLPKVKHHKAILEKDL
ncbi:phage integrase central domain-containing protein, partial [Helicobacter bilis]